MASGGLIPQVGEGVPLLDGATPWFGPWWPWAEPAWAHWHLHGSVAAALNALPSQAPVQFVPQAELPEGQAYEGFIFAQQRVPTRDNLHDFFNGCCWHRFPQTKLRLNQLQGEEIQRLGVQATRGPLRDALTLFDENVALLQAPDELWQALEDRDWHHLFVTLRPLWHEVRWVVFGHALLEKLVQPYKSITAHVYRVAPEVAPGDRALDAWLAATLTPEHLARKPYQPLPVMGIPGWSPANEEPSYYADREVFRPRR
jgi:hypothetical protein